MSKPPWVLRKIISRCLACSAKIRNVRGPFETPERVAKAMQYLTQGYHMNAIDIINSAKFHENVSEMVIVKDIGCIACANIIYCLLLAKHILPIFQTVGSPVSTNWRVW